MLYKPMFLPNSNPVCYVCLFCLLIRSFCICFRAGVEELQMWGLFCWDLQDHRTPDPRHLQPDYCCCECELWALPLWAIPRWPPRLHLRAPDLLWHQRRSLSRPSEVYWVDLCWSGDGLCRCDAFSDLLGHLCPREEAPGLHEAVHHPASSGSWERPMRGCESPT